MSLACAASSFIETIFVPAMPKFTFNRRRKLDKASREFSHVQAKRIRLDFSAINKSVISPNEDAILQYLCRQERRNLKRSWEEIDLRQNFQSVIPREQNLIADGIFFESQSKIPRLEPQNMVNIDEQNSEDHFCFLRISTEQNCYNTDEIAFLKNIIQPFTGDIKPQYDDNGRFLGTAIIRVNGFTRHEIPMVKKFIRENQNVRAVIGSSYQEFGSKSGRLISIKDNFAGVTPEFGKEEDYNYNIKIKSGKFLNLQRTLLGDFSSYRPPGRRLKLKF
ncbi:hypothetical protein ACOME3_003665 [Neoechinorhynchus agilis]